MWNVRFPVSLAVSLLVAAVFHQPAEAHHTARHATSPGMETGTVVPSPFGFVDFCRRNPDECGTPAASGGDRKAEFTLTNARRAELDAVQRAVNAAVTYRTDPEHYGMRDYWTFPETDGTDAVGDCEDIALEKRRRLIALGWPRSSLLLTGARIEDGRHHLVLIAVTAEDEWVLDNLRDDVVGWKAVDYRWLLRQSRHDETVWVRISAPERTNTSLTSAGAGAR